MIAFIAAMSAGRAVGARHQTNALIVAHGLEVDAGRLRDLSDRQQSRFRDHNSLEPVVGTDSI